MTIQLPQVQVGSQPLSKEQARPDFAVGLYTGGHLSVGRAAESAAMPKIRFKQELGKRGIPRHYTAEDTEHDMRMLEEPTANKRAA